MATNLASPTVADARLDGMLNVELVSLARDLAQDILLAEDILRTHGFTGVEDPRWAYISRTAEFRRLHAEQVAEWSKVDSTPKRIRAKALAAVEAGIIHSFEIWADKAESGANRVKAGQHLTALAGMEAAGSNGAAATPSGPGFSITINMANGESVRVLDARLNSPTGASVVDSTLEDESEE